MSGWNDARVGCSSLDKECVCGVEGGGEEYGEFFSFVRLLCWFCLGASILQVSPLFCVYFYFLYIFIISLIDFNNIEI